MKLRSYISTLIKTLLILSVTTLSFSQEWWEDDLDTYDLDPYGDDYDMLDPFVVDGSDCFDFEFWVSDYCYEIWYECPSSGEFEIYGPYCEGEPGEEPYEDDDEYGGDSGSDDGVYDSDPWPENPEEYTGEFGETFSFRLTTRIASQEQADDYQFADAAASLSKVTIVGIASGGGAGLVGLSASAAGTVSTVTSLGLGVAELFNTHRYNTGDVVVEDVVMTRVDTDFGVEVHREVTIYREGLAPSDIDVATPLDGSTYNSTDPEKLSEFIYAPINAIIEENVDKGTFWEE